MIHFVVPRESDFGMQDYLALYGQALAERMTVLHWEELPGRREVPKGTWVFAALDQLRPAGLRFASALHDELVAAGQPVFNSPSATLQRHDLLIALHREGLNRHRAVRAEDDLSGLRYPVFLHEEHHHTGALTPLLRDARELRAALGGVVLRGFRLDNMLVVEFFDTVGADGLYRKYAAFKVGHQIIPRALSRGPSWGLKHSGSEYTPEMFEEERGYVLGNPHEAQLRRIFDVARVGYGRIDYAVRDGVVETWEINLNPTIGRSRNRNSGAIPEHLRWMRDETRNAFYAGFQHALEQIDTPAGGAAITLAPSEELSSGAEMVRPALSPRRFGLARAIVRPFRRVFDPIARLFQPLLGRAAGPER